LEVARKVSDIALELADREAIRETLMSYPRALDRIDMDIAAKVYWPEAVDDHAGMFDGKMAEHRKIIERNLRTAEATQHFYCNMLIEIDGSEARTETYAIAYHGHDNDGQKSTWIIGGRALDRLEKRDDEWRIVERNLLFDWAKHIADPEGLADPLAHAINGARAPDDASMGHFKKLFAAN
jgi:hypothetical protein